MSTKSTEAAFFTKEFPRNPVRLASGKPIKWLDVGHGLGAYKATDAGEIAELTEAAKAGRFGIVLSTEEAFNDLKKNTLSSPAPKKPKQPKPLSNKPSPAPAAESQKPASAEGAAGKLAINDQPVVAAPPTET